MITKLDLEDIMNELKAVTYYLDTMAETNNDAHFYQSNGLHHMSNTLTKVIDIITKELNKGEDHE
jgi:hypothetical protein